MENLQIADSQITASSSKDSKSIPSQARLKIQPSSSTSGAWCAKNNKKVEDFQSDARRNIACLITGNVAEV